MKRVFLISFLLPAIILGGCSANRGSLSLSEAEEQLRLKKYDEAIASYRKHIEQRLKVDDRPEWENPYFYLMLIVDIELQRNNIDGAKKALEEAQAKGVDSTLVADRWRSLARWYELRGENENAMNLLREHREMDPLLFDAILDRLAKKIVLLEEQSSTDSPPQGAADMEAW